MARSGSALGSVVRWDDERNGAIIEIPDLPGACWADASVVVHSTARNGRLRAGQVVAVDWTEEDAGEWPLRASRVEPREDLQTSLGG